MIPADPERSHVSIESTVREIVLAGAIPVVLGGDHVGMDVVEVLPTGIGSTDVTALVAERIVRETLTGIALRRRRLLLV